MLARAWRSVLEVARLAFEWCAKRYLLATDRRILKLTRTDRIGHLMGELDCVMKEERLLHHASPRRPLLLARRDQLANLSAVRSWRPHMDIVESPWLVQMLERVADDPVIRFRDAMRPYFTAIDETATVYSILREWGDRPPLLELGDAEMKRGEAALRELGLPEGAPFVCFHCREPGYSPSDEVWHSFRNSSIKSYLPSMAALHERGIYGVRMGDPSMARLPAIEGVIDYVHSPLRSDWMDVFLCARTEFFLGNSSGLYLISLAFGRPSALANLAPLSTALGTAPGDVVIPKLLRHEKEGRLLGFPEILSLPVGNFRFAKDYRAANIRALESEPEDVTALALEMFDRTRGLAEYDAADDARQARYQALFAPGHYAFGSGGRAGRDFLRKYEHLLD